MKIFVDDLIRVLVDIHNDGYKYCDIDFLDEDQFDGEVIPAGISLAGLDEGGAYEQDYDNVEINEVSADEISRYAFQGRTSAPKRKSIKKIRIEKF